MVAERSSGRLANRKRSNLRNKIVMANLTQRQSEKLFGKMQKIVNAGGLAFFQKRMKPIEIKESEFTEAETIQGFEYIVMRTKRS